MAKSTPATKKRKPPTFPHLPLDRAKKLKQSWVVKQKIKSQWKAQKRREGLLTKATAKEEPRAQQDDSGDEDEGNASEDSKPDHSQPDDEGSEMDSDIERIANERNNESTSDGPSRNPQPFRSRVAAGKSPQRTKNPAQSNPISTPQPVLRGLYKQAYAPSHASHLYHGPRGSSHHNERGGSRQRGRGPTRGGLNTRGRGGSMRGSGRGQPDMGLRMKAMLEKIKRDLV